MQETAALRYSHALFESGKELSKIDVFLQQMQDVAKIFSTHNELFELFNHPNIRNEEKKNVIDVVFKGMNKEITNLIMLLIEHKRIHEIAAVYEDFKKAVYEYKGIKVAYATTAIPMDPDEIEMLREKLSLKYSSKFEVENILEPKVLGGVYLKIGDEVIDGSISGQLERMRKELFKA